MKEKLMLCISMAVFGTLGMFTRYIPLSSGQLALARAVLAAALLGAVLLISKKKIKITLGKELLLLLLSGAAMGVNWILLFQAYKFTSVSAATLSYYFAPVIVTAVSPFLFKEKLTPLQIVCFAASTLGAGLLVGFAGGGKSDTVGILFGLGAAVFYATVIILNKYIKSIDGISRTFMQFVAAIVTLLPYVLLAEGVSVTGFDTRAVLALLCVGLVHTGITYCLYFSAIKELRGQTAAILSYIDPLVAVLISVFILGEAITIPQIIGGTLILAFTLINELSNNHGG